MKESTKLEYKVGIFLAVGAIVFMVIVLMLGADKTFFTRYVHLRARFTEVNGLFPGSVVSLMGIPVGNVDAITFVPNENKLEVDLKIDRSYGRRLFEGTIADIRTQGALGDKYVFLTPGEPGSKHLSDGQLIESKEEDFMKLLTSREDGVARVVDVIKELHILLASINQNGQVGTTMRNFGEASAKLKSTLGELDVVLKDIHDEVPKDHKLKAALVNLSSILEKIDSGKGTLGALINDPSVHQSLKAMLGGSPRNKYVKDMIRESLSSESRMK